MSTENGTGPAQRLDGFGQARLPVVISLLGALYSNLNEGAKIRDVQPYRPNPMAFGEEMLEQRWLRHFEMGPILLACLASHSVREGA